MASALGISAPSGSPAAPTLLPSAGERLVAVSIPRAEKRREGGKHYVYELLVEVEVPAADAASTPPSHGPSPSHSHSHTTVVTRRLWRRYSQFDALRVTLAGVLGSEAALPRLTRKLYLKRSSVHDVAIMRQPKLLSFLTQLIHEQNNPLVAATLRFFLTPTAADLARERMPDNPEDIVVFGEEDQPPVEAEEGAAGPPGSQADDAGHTGAGTTPAGKSLSTASRVRALYDYEAKSDAELSFKAGEELMVEARFDHGWCECRGRGGKIGMVPESYVVDLADGVGGARSSATTGISSPAGLASPVMTRANASTGSDHASSEARAPAAMAAAPRSAQEELLTTEQQYVAALREVRDNFFPRLRGIVSAVEGKTLFNNWGELVPAHEELLKEMQKAKGTGELPKLMKRCMQQMQDMYGRYCAGLPRAHALYEQKLQDKRFLKFEASFPELNKPTLNHFMRPFQRALKYPLLLNEICKTAPTVDLHYWQQAKSQAEELANAANANMNAEQEKLDKNLISNPDAASFQVLVKGTDEQVAAARRQALTASLDEESSTDAAVEERAAAVRSPPPPGAPPPPAANAKPRKLSEEILNFAKSSLTGASDGSKPSAPQPVASKGKARSAAGILSSATAPASAADAATKSASPTAPKPPPLPPASAATMAARMKLAGNSAGGSALGSAKPPVPPSSTDRVPTSTESTASERRPSGGSRPAALKPVGIAPPPPPGGLKRNAPAGVKSSANSDSSPTAPFGAKLKSTGLAQLIGTETKATGDGHENSSTGTKKPSSPGKQVARMAEKFNSGGSAPVSPLSPSSGPLSASSAASSGTPNFAAAVAAAANSRFASADNGSDSDMPIAGNADGGDAQADGKKSRNRAPPPSKPAPSLAKPS